MEEILEVEEMNEEPDMDYWFDLWQEGRIGSFGTFDGNEELPF